MSYDANDLRWEDVAPDGTAFDVEALRPAIASILRGVVNRELRAQALDRIRDHLATEVGLWAAACDFDVTRGDGTGWCCASHSILPSVDADEGPTVDRICTALASWRAYLDELAEIFRRRESADTPAEVVELALPMIVARLVERTTTDDAWYYTVETALRWLFETLVPDPVDAAAMASSALDGKFRSWVGPQDAELQAATAAATAEVARAPAVEAPRDGLAAWTRNRTSAFFGVPVRAARPAAAVDGHARYIETHDRARDPVRADRMAAALLLCRDAATCGLPLSFDLLREWQAVVLGAAAPVELRTRDAFAKGGRERYPCSADLGVQFARALAQADAPDVQVSVRAARVYLDVCFFHPFDDGNARAARLALDHVLSRAGVRLRVAAPVFAVPRGAHDERGAWSLACTIERLLVSV